MRNRLVVFLLLGVCLVFVLLFGRQVYLGRGLPRAQFSDKKIRVLTYSTFIGSSGPGREIVDRFKKAHGCDVEVVTSGDAGLLLERLRMAQASTPFDVVIGLDQMMLEDARNKSKWKRVEDKEFVAFDWSPMTFVYRKGAIEPPKTFDELLDPRFKGRIALQDPRSSSPGVQFYNWVGALKDDGTADYLAKLQPNVQSVSPSWAFSYGLFKKQQADLVFSYVTSLAFHWGVEKDRSYQVVAFAQGHPIQTEFAAVPEGCRECELAHDFVVSLVQADAQKAIMEKNFMFPVLRGVEQGTIFAELPQLKTYETPSKMRNLSDWDKVFKH